MALKGVKVIEMLGLAPGPFCGTLLADFGASVTVVQKTDLAPFDVMSHGKRMLSLNLKTKEGIQIMKKLCLSSDVLLDTFRPGVMEKLQLGPDVILKENPRLIYARLTGYGQHGHYKSKAGHDINYVAMSGVLSALKKPHEPPTPPINLIADFAGGGLNCAFGITLALFERAKSGKGQIIDVSMTEGAAYLSSWLYKSKTLPIWSGEAGTNVLDGGYAQYSTYQTKDGKYMAVGALEPQFYSNLLKGLEISEEQHDQLFENEAAKALFKQIFMTKTRNEWCEIFENIDACVTPVLDMDEVDKHKCNSSRSSFNRDIHNMVYPEPAPKLSRTPGRSCGNKSLPKQGQDTIPILQELGYSSKEIESLIAKTCVVTNQKSKM